jgi:tRNA G37 N-methylase TrmD
MTTETEDGIALIKQMGFDADLARNLIEIVKISVAAGREEAIEECVKAARDGFEKTMENYVLIGPSGMAMQMINSIKALRT